MNHGNVFELLENAWAWTARTSLSAAVLIVLTIFLVSAFPRIFGPRWRLAFGVLILLRLLMPLSPESGISYLNLVKISPAPVPGSFHPAIPAPAAPQDPLPFIEPHPAPFPFSDVFAVSAFPPAADAPSPSRIERHRISALFAVSLLWIGGTVSLIGFMIFRGLRFGRWIRKHSIPSQCPRLRALLDLCRNRLGLHREIPLVSTPRLRCAAVFGWRRPRLLIGEDFGERFDNAQIRGIFLHELAHIRRQDVLWNWLSHLTLALHWFNPLVWIAARRFRADREQICDAIALRHLAPEQQQSYAKALLEALRPASASLPAPAFAPALAPFFSRKTEIKKRIAMMTRKKTSPHWAWHGLAALALAAAAGFTFTSATADDKITEREKPPEIERDGDRPAPPEGRPDGDRPAPPEGRRDGDRPAPPEGRRDGDRPAPPEGRRDGDRPAPPEGRRDGDRPAPPEGRRDGDRPAPPEGRRGGDRPAPPEGRRDPEPGRDPLPPEREREFAQARQKMAEMENALREAEKDRNEEKVRDIRKQMEELRRDIDRRGEAVHAEMRMRHLQQAVGNLEAAGLHDQANALRRQADEIEREMRRRHEEPRDREKARHSEQLEREVMELRKLAGEQREQIQRLEEELRRAKASRE